MLPSSSLGLLLASGMSTGDNELKVLHCSARGLWYGSGLAAGDDDGIRPGDSTCDDDCCSRYANLLVIASKLSTGGSERIAALRMTPRPCIGADLACSSGL
jgi:hypothetical protein